MASFQPIPWLMVSDDVGAPLVGGKIFTYISGTTTLKTTYTDAALTVPNTNPIILNARGEAQMALASGAYSLRLLRADDTLVKTIDNVTDPILAGIAAAAASEASIRADLSATTGSSIVGFIQSGIAAILRLVQDKLRESVTLEDFGGVGNGIADESLALSRAQVLLVNGGVIRGLNGKQYYFPAGFTLNKGISFVGTWVTREDVSVHDPLQGCSAILIDGTATITIANGAELTKWLVWRKGLVAATSAVDAAAKVAGFVGTAITAGGADAKVRLNTIIGFNKAIVSASFERGIFDENQFDCTNGLDVSLSTDITHVRRNHGWPFFTAHQSWTTPALLQRSGTAYKIYGTADFIHVNQNFAYGYTGTYYFADLAAATVTDNKADNVFALATGRIGIETRGNMNNVSFNNNHVDSHDINYKFAHTAGCTVGGVNTSGQSKGASIQCGAGTNGSFGRFAVGGNCTYVIDFLAGIGKWRIDSMYISSAASSGSAYNIAIADRPNVQIGWTSVTAGVATDDNFGYGLSTAPFVRPNHSSKTGLFVNGLDGTMGVSVNGFPSAIFTPVGSAVNFMTVAAGVAGNKVSIGADGEANVTLALVPKGTGSLLLSVPYVAAAVAQTGYVIMLDSTGTPRRFLIG